MLLTSIKNLPTIKENAENLGITYKVRNGTVRIYSKGLSDHHIQNRLGEDHGIGSIVEREPEYA